MPDLGGGLYLWKSKSVNANASITNAIITDNYVTMGTGLTSLGRRRRRNPSSGADSYHFTYHDRSELTWPRSHLWGGSLVLALH